MIYTSGESHYSLESQQKPALLCGPHTKTFLWCVALNSLVKEGLGLHAGAGW